MTDYGLYVDPDSQVKQYRRFAPRSGGASADFPDFKNFQFDGPEASSALKFAVSKKLVFEFKPHWKTVCEINRKKDVNKWRKKG